MKKSRKGKEFSQDAIDSAFRRADGKDEITGQPLGDNTEVDHIIPIAWAHEHAPDILPHLGDSKNARVLNRSTHKDRHRNFDPDEAWALVAFFRSIQKRLFG